MLALVKSATGYVEGSDARNAKTARLGVGPHDDASLCFIPLKVLGIGKGRQIVSPLRRRHERKFAANSCGQFGRHADHLVAARRRISMQSHPQPRSLIILSVKVGFGFAALITALVLAFTVTLSALP